jgi:O-antigen/teichoic acid export membrane protein
MSIRALIKNSSIYSITILLQKGINFLLIPILTIYLTPSDYGIISVVTTINAFLNVFYLFGLNGSLNRFFYEYKENNKKIEKLFGTIITFVLINSFVLTALLLIFHEWTLDLILNEIEFFPFMILGLISILFSPVFIIYQSSLQARQLSSNYAKNNIAFFFLNIILLIISVVILKMGALGVLGALGITNFCFFIFTILRFENDLKFGIQKAILIKVLKYSIPILPHSLSGVVTGLIDRIIINNLLSSALVGIYSIGNNFGSIVFMFAQGINQAFVPWFNQKVKKGDLTQISDLSKILVLFYSLLALSLSLFGKEIIELITPNSYHESWKVIPFISFAFVYHGVYYFFAGPLFYDIDGRGNRLIPFSTVSAALINILLNVFLIPIWGIIGASIATLVSKFLLSLSLKFYYNKFIKIKLPELFLLLIPILFFGISLISFYTDSLEHEFLVKVTLFLFINFVLFLSFKNKISNISFKKFK